MSLQFILGSSGSGKSHYLYQQIIQESMIHPDKLFFIIVPEQFTMQTQRELVERQKNNGILNIDVVSFQRLSYRIFDELGLSDHKVLEETGKSFVLRKVAEEKMEQLKVLKSSIKKIGYINEVKSIISELAQYRISVEQLEDFLHDETQPVPLRYRLSDIHTIYQGFKEYLAGNYVTGEEVLEVLAKEAGRSKLLHNCTIALDGFTGFTPIQNHLLQHLMRCAGDIYVAITLDQRESLTHSVGIHDLFQMSKKTIMVLNKMAAQAKIEVKTPVQIAAGARFQAAPALSWLEQNLFRQVAKSYTKAVDNIAIYRLKNPRQELLFTAGEIRRLIREEGLRYKDIAVVSGDVELYGNYVPELFDAYDIPYFLDRKNSITYHPMTEMIRNLLKAIEQDFSYESMFAYLRSGLCRITNEEIDLVENYVLANRLRGSKTWQKQWIRQSGADTTEELVQINEIRVKIIDNIIAVAKTLTSTTSTVKEKTVTLYQFIISQDVQRQLEHREKQLEQVGNHALARQYGQMYKLVMDLLDKLTTLLGEEKLSLFEYREILEAGFESAAVGIIPPGSDQVLIGDIERTRLSHIKVLFFLGVNDGLIPKNAEKGGLISQQEREILKNNRIELAPTVRERAFIQKFYLYLNLTKPSKKLYLTWFRNDSNGKEARKSYLIGIIKKLYPQLEQINLEAPNELAQLVTPKSSRHFFVEALQKARTGVLSMPFIALYQWYCSHEQWSQSIAPLLEAAFYRYQDEDMDAQVTKSLYGAVLENSVSRLERFCACAFSHFMTYGIGLKERQLGEFAPVDIGTMFHDALERYSLKIEAGGYHWFDVPAKQQEAWAEQAVDETVTATAGSMIYEDARTEYAIARIKRILKRTIDTISVQIAESNFTPAGYEVSFSFAQDAKAINFTLDEGEKMRLKGRIDRLDTKEEQGQIYVKVVDYKSGQTKFQLLSLYHGLQLQLVVYLGAAMEIVKEKNPDKEVCPSGMYYYKIDDPVVSINGSESEAEIKKKILDQLKLDGLGTDSSDESVNKKSRTANAEELKLLSDFVNHKIKTIGSRIYKGNIAIHPYKLKDQTGCDYCPYHSVCGFDPKLPGYGYHHLADIKEKQEILDQMKEEL